MSIMILLWIHARWEAMGRAWRRCWHKPVVVYCPRCERRQARFWPASGGRTETDFGPGGWVAGELRCPCGFRDPDHSESWP